MDKIQQYFDFHNAIEDQRLQIMLRGQNAVNMKPIHIDVPRFEGGDPQGWIKSNSTLIFIML